MKCARCEHENEAGAKFCEECAAPLARTCKNCGRPLSPRAKFCPECAHPAASPLHAATSPRFTSPEGYTPKHLAEKIFTSRAALEAGASSISTGVASPVAVGTNYLGWSLAELGEFAEATRRTEESLRLAEALENPHRLMTACMGVGMVHLRQGNVPAALPPLEHGLQICHTFGFTALMFHGIAASLGAAYALVNRSAEAIALLRKVADQAASMKLVSDHLLGAIPLAEVALATGQDEEAAQRGAHALDLARRHKQRGHEAYALRLLGEVAARRDDTDAQAAEAHYQGAIGLARELGMRPLIAHCHLGLGRLHRRTGKREQAQEHLTTATTMYREMDMRFWLEQVKAEMSKVG
jgi:tetratricopeptide (TPR) repeat protein